jgi:hypothetical protein
MCVFQQPDRALCRIDLARKFGLDLDLREFDRIQMRKPSRNMRLGAFTLAPTPGILEMR